MTLTTCSIDIYRPTLSVQHSELRAWWTAERFEVAHRLARAEKVRQGERNPTYSLELDFCRDRKTVTRWRRGQAIPYGLSLVQIDRVLSALLGRDWMKQVDAELSKQKEIRSWTDSQNGYKRSSTVENGSRRTSPRTLSTKGRLD